MSIPTPQQRQRWLANLRGALNSPARRSDGPGYCYVFATDVELRPNRRLRRLALKFGRTGDLRHRRAQWRRSCPGQRQDWLYAYWVPYAGKFERIIQYYLKLEGAWLGRVRCDSCGKSHIEKFCSLSCGGPTGLRKIIRRYLKKLHWPIRSVPA
ncbi:hypothetical protein C8J57DRAFT_1225041 [Mycena rebaudengoi]|nr:hypothetical protein C8J57DRAFT_1225041 [Mycena rebaudengoi]